MFSCRLFFSSLENFSSQRVTDEGRITLLTLEEKIVLRLFQHLNSGTNMDSSPLRPPYLNRDVFCHEMVEAAAATLEDATSTVLSTLTAPATATARKDDDSSRNVASPASPVSPISFPSSSSSSSSGSGPGLKKIAEADGYEFFHFCGSGGEGGSGGNGEGERNSAAALPLAEIEALVEEAWAHDYRRSDQARFVYTRAYLEWFTQRDCCDFLLAREKVFDDPAPAAGAGAGANM